MDAYIYVQARDGSPLMPTKRSTHVQKLLKHGRAYVVEHVPLVIRLRYDSPKNVQPLFGGTDAGRTNIGNAVIRQDGTVVYKDNVTTRNRDIAKLMRARRGYRQASRRGERLARKRLAKRLGTTMKSILRRKLPGCGDGIMTVRDIINTEARFSNRSRPAGWFTPTVRQLVQTHVNMIRRIRAFLPVDTWTLETNSFAFMRLEDGSVHGADFRNGRLKGFRSVRDYILHVQGGKCLCCGKEMEHCHHIVPQYRNGSDRWYNLAGLCGDCHRKVHTGELSLASVGEKERYAGTSVLNQAVPYIVAGLTELLPVLLTCTGKDTHDCRERFSVPKTHADDAVCIAAYGASATAVKDAAPVYGVQQFRRHDRARIKCQRERTYYSGRTLIAKNRRPRFEQACLSLAEAGLSRQEVSRLTVKKSVRYYNNASRLMPGAEFFCNGSRYIMTGQLSGGAYLRAAGQGAVNFKRSDCRIVRKNRGLVYLGTE